MDDEEREKLAAIISDLSTTNDLYQKKQALLNLSRVAQGELSARVEGVEAEQVQTKAEARQARRDAKREKAAAKEAKESSLDLIKSHGNTVGFIYLKIIMENS